MSELDFIAALVGSLAWPTAVIVGIVLLRDRVGDLISRVDRMKMNDFEVVFEKAIGRVKVELEEVQKEAGITKVSEPAPGTDILSKISPNAAVLSAWQELESTMMDIAVGRGLRGPNLNFDGVLGFLMNRGFLSKEHVSLINQLRGLRNLALHSGPNFQVSRDSVERYGVVVRSIINVLQISS